MISTSHLCSNRRDFLRRSTASLLATVPVMNTLLNLKASAALIPEPNDYRALVCVFLHGGYDSYNVLVPTSSTEYADYRATRSNLALPATGTGAVLPLTVANTPGRTFGVHPGLPRVRGLFNSGKLAFLSNVGALVEPSTVSEFWNQSTNGKRYPLALFSHSDQTQHWQTSIPQSRTGIVGWAGRMADMLNAATNNSALAMNISLAGYNMMQVGEDTTFFSMNADGPQRLTGDGNSSGRFRVQNDALRDLCSQTHRNLYEQAFADQVKDSIDLSRAFGDAWNNSQVTTSFATNNSLAQNLRSIAKTIGARQALGVKRQVFFVVYGGWDHHQELLANQAYMLPQLDAAFQGFHDALVELGVWNNVVTFTSSEFARTLRSNGRGTDHAWGGNHMIMGGPVDGGKIYGQYPIIRFNSPRDIGGGGLLLPTTSCDEYFAELISWFGVPISELSTILPNLTNFYSPSLSARPIGFIPNI
ncbi:MAG: DUF1501 domain-containing protein [Akkermansiaceae bacterium]|nr:DUF1501 domain-containing protein [Akkermansiaceae bacterium]